MTPAQRVNHSHNCCHHCHHHQLLSLMVVSTTPLSPLPSTATANAAGIPVVSFALEGTAVGNIASQLIALRAVKDLPTFRRLLGATLAKKIYAPR